jgi:hypothetical protein
MTSAPQPSAPAPSQTAVVPGVSNVPKVDTGAQVPAKDNKKTGAQESKTEGQKDQEVKEAIEKFKLLIDGVEEEVDKTELIKRAQKATASDKKFQEAAKIRRQSEDLIRLLKADPWRVLQHPSLGHDVRKLAEQFLYERIQEDAMTPEQKESLEAKRKVKEYEDMIQQQKVDDQNKQMATLRAKYEDSYSKDIIETLKVSGLPQTPSTVRRMAYYMHQALLKGYELKANDVVSLVRQDYETEIKELFGPLDAQTLVELLGEDTAKKIRLADLSKLKKPGQTISAKEQAPSPEGSPNKKKGISLEEWRERNRKIMEGEE